MNSAGSALVIGSGIAGPATAIALQKAGIDCAIYEAHPATADGAGVFLTLAPNGVDALRVLGVDQPATRGGFATPSITLRSFTGKYLGRTRTGLMPPDGATSQTVKRADLYRALQEQARSRGIRVEHGKRLVFAEDTCDGVRAHFADGTEAIADVLIGCDGVHSVVRSVIDPAAPEPSFSGLLTTGGYASGIDVESEPGHYEMIFGRRAFFGYVVAPDRQVWWFANVPMAHAPSRDELNAAPDEQRRQLLQVFAGDAGPAVNLIEATPQIMPMSPIHAIPHLPIWHAGRMVVIGDAAHAPSPTSGQGASLAIEDAVILAMCLRDAASPREAFAGFEALRRRRVERIVKAAARINNSKAAGPVGRVVRDAVLPVVLKLTADGKAQRRVFDYHVDWDDAARTGARSA